MTRTHQPLITLIITFLILLSLLLGVRLVLQRQLINQKAASSTGTATLAFSGPSPIALGQPLPVTVSYTNSTAAADKGGLVGVRVSLRYPSTLLTLANPATDIVPLLPAPWVYRPASIGNFDSTTKRLTIEAYYRQGSSQGYPPAIGSFARINFTTLSTGTATLTLITNPANQNQSYIYAKSANTDVLSSAAYSANFIITAGSPTLTPTPPACLPEGSSCNPTSLVNPCCKGLFCSPQTSTCVPQLSTPTPTPVPPTTTPTPVPPTPTPTPPACLPEGSSCNPTSLVNPCCKGLYCSPQTSTCVPQLSTPTPTPVPPTPTPSRTPTPTSIPSPTPTHTPTPPACLPENAVCLFNSLVNPCCSGLSCIHQPGQDPSLGICTKGTGLGSVNFTMKFQGSAAPNQTTVPLDLRFYPTQGGNPLIANITVRSNSLQIWSGLVANYLPVGTYTVLAKGPKHLQKNLGQITITSSAEITADWTSTPLLAGDVVIDNQLTQADINAILSTWTTLVIPVNPGNQIYDLNFDGNLTLADVNLFLSNWTSLVISGDNI